MFAKYNNIKKNTAVGMLGGRAHSEHAQGQEVDPPVHTESSSNDCRTPWTVYFVCLRRQGTSFLSHLDPTPITK